MKTVYIAGSYRSAHGTNGIHDNIEKARTAAIAFWRLGCCVICPHMNSSFMDGAVNDKAFLNGGLELLRRSDMVYFLKGWQKSSGSRLEHDEASLCGKEIEYEGDADTEKYIRLDTLNEMLYEFKKLNENTYLKKKMAVITNSIDRIKTVEIPIEK